jgi:hypothetical protein
LRKVAIVKPKEVQILPFTLKDFMSDKIQEVSLKDITKKELKILAKQLNLEYDDAQIAFTKKLLHALVIYR